jgi:hypothetical protein
MQSVEAQECIMSDLIEVTFTEGKWFKIRAWHWAHMNAFSPMGRLLSNGISLLVFILMFLGAVSLADMLNRATSAHLTTISTEMMGMIIAGGLQLLWYSLLTSSMGRAKDTSARGQIVYRFDADGFEMTDALSRQRVSWAAIPRMANTTGGLAMAQGSQLFYLPAASWENREVFDEETAQIAAWWQKARLGHSHSDMGPDGQ